MGRVVFEIGIVKAVVLFISLFAAGMATAYVLNAVKGMHRQSEQ